MEFVTVLSEISLALLYMLPAFVLGKLKKFKTESLKDISFFLLYVCSPCMIVNAFIGIEFTKEIALNMLWFFLVTFVLQIVVMVAIYFIFCYKKENPFGRLLSVGTVAGNVGFIGLPVITNLFPGNPEVGCYSCIFSVSMNLIMFSLGIFIMTGDKRFMTIKKALVNPSTISVLIGVPLFITGILNNVTTPVLKEITDVLLKCISMFGKITTPLCMIILGVRLSNVSFKAMIRCKLMYSLSLTKLILFPLFCYLCVYFLPFSQVFKASILILSATPCASMILNFAEIYNVQQDDAANSAIATNILAVITMPVLALLI